MDEPKKQLIQRLNESANVLVTVPSSPSVDQLAGAIGLTLMLNKLGKHATAVFSGDVPDTLEFLEPDKTLEKTTDSLRDFIISLDKAKADKLRYKVEDQHVKIFITPYRTSLSQDDLEFSQGDFNVDVVVALGIHEQQELDQAIVAHGRILHDATVSSINNQQKGNLGTINWIDPTASSLCEMLVTLCNELKSGSLDAQMATALLTGIVSETRRFSNDKTTSKTMSLSAQLMTAGANQQLVASKLQADLKSDNNSAPAKTKSEDSSQKATQKDGSLQIDHNKTSDDTSKSAQEPDLQQIHIDDDGQIKPADSNSKPSQKGDPTFIHEPPSLGGQLTANSEPEHLDPAIDPLAGGTHNQPLLSRDKATKSKAESMMPLPQPQTDSEKNVKSDDTRTLDAIEKSVDSTHQATGADVAPEDSHQSENLDSARDAVSNAINSSPGSSPKQDVSAQIESLVNNPTDPQHPIPAQPQPNFQQPSVPGMTATPGAVPGDNYQKPLQSTSDNYGLPPVPNMPSPQGVPYNPSLSQNLVPLNPGLPPDNTASKTGSPAPPPPVPPPMMPPLPPRQDSQNSS